MQFISRDDPRLRGVRRGRAEIKGVNTTPVDRLEQIELDLGGGDGTGGNGAELFGDGIRGLIVSFGDLGGSWHSSGGDLSGDRPFGSATGLVSSDPGATGWWLETKNPETGNTRWVFAVKGQGWAPGTGGYPRVTEERSSPPANWRPTGERAQEGNPHGVVNAHASGVAQREAIRPNQERREEQRQAEPPQGRQTPNPDGSNRLVRTVFTASVVERALRQFERPDPRSDAGDRDVDPGHPLSREAWELLRSGGHTDPSPTDTSRATPKRRVALGLQRPRYATDAPGWGK